MLQLRAGSFGGKTFMLMFEFKVSRVDVIMGTIWQGIPLIGQCRCFESILLCCCAGVKSSLCPPVYLANMHLLSTPRSTALCGHSNLKPRLPLWLWASTISWHRSVAEETLSPFVLIEMSCSHPFASGSDGKEQLTNQLSGTSFSTAHWETSTVVSFLSDRPEIIQSTHFELQIREEEDDPRHRAEEKKWKGTGEVGCPEQVYGNWRGPSKIKTETDAIISFAPSLAVKIKSCYFKYWFKLPFFQTVK